MNKTLFHPQRILFMIIVLLFSVMPAMAHTPGTTQEGWFSVYWWTPPPGSNIVGENVYMLALDDGHRIPLDIDPATLARSGGLLALNGQRVQVELSEEATRSEGEAVPVNSIELVTPDKRSPQSAYTPLAVSGSQPWVTIMCSFTGTPAGSDTATVNYFQNMYSASYPGMDHYWRQQSFGAVNLLGSNSYGWFTLPHPQTYYFPTPGSGGDDSRLAELFTDCVAAADSSVNFAPYVGINMMFNGTLNCCAWGGGEWATLDGVSKNWRLTWNPPWSWRDITVVSHEIGHGFGLPHANNYDGDNDTYDSPWDVMSDTYEFCGNSMDLNYGCLGQHTSAYHKDVLGWIPENRQFIAESSTGPVTLDNIAMQTADDYQIIKIPITGSSNYYVVEARQNSNSNYDVKLPGKAVIIWEINESRQEPAWQVGATSDALAASVSAGADGAWLAGETFTNGSIQISVLSETTDGFVVSVTRDTYVSPAPSNDLISKAEVLTDSIVDTTNNLYYATISASDPALSCRYNGPAVGSNNIWYKYTPATDKIISLDTFSSPAPIDDTILAIYTGTPGALTEVACNDDAGSGWLSQISNFDASGGTTYYIVATRWSAAPLTTAGTLVFNFVVTSPPNASPVAGTDSKTVNEGEFIEFPDADLLANDSDPDGDSISMVGINTQPTRGTVTRVAGVWKYQHNGSETTTDSFKYTIQDENGKQANGTVNVTITPVNDTPVAGNDNATVAEGATANINVLLNDSDAEGTALTVTINTPPANGTATVQPNKTITYVHNGGETTGDSFTYTVSDGGKTANATVNITVTAVNDTPLAGNDNATVDEGAAVNINVLANDSDAEGTPLTVTIATHPTKGTAAVQGDKTITYTHNGGETTSDSFTYTISDGSKTATATVSISITAINDAPVAGNDTATLVVGTGKNINVLVNDSDAEGTALVVTINTPPSNGTAEVQGDKTITYTHNGGDSTSDSFTYTVSDGDKSATATVTLTITPPNQAPVATNDAATVNEGGSINITVLGNDSDPENTPLTVTNVSTPANGTAVNVNNVITYTHNGGETTGDTFTYTISDGDLTATATVTITVTPVKDLTNLVLNGGFETGTALPASWTPVVTLTADRRFCETTKNNITPYGKCVYRFKATAASPLRSIRQDIVTVGMVAGDSLSLRYNARGISITGTVQVMLRVYYPGVTTPLNITSTLPKGTYTWLMVVPAKTIVLSQTPEKVKLFLRANKMIGTAYIDEVVVNKLDVARGFIPLPGQ